MEGDQRRQPTGGTRPLNDCTDERLVAPVDTIERANGQGGFLTEIGLGQIIYYVHIAALLNASPREGASLGSKDFFGAPPPGRSMIGHDGQKVTIQAISAT